MTREDPLNLAAHGLAPGDYVRHPTQPDWGLGQVQSATGSRVTVNFEEVGKQTILTDIVTLLPSAP